MSGISQVSGTFLSLSSLGISATLVRPTLIRLSTSRLENSSVIPSIFPSLEWQLSRNSSLTWRKGEGKVRGVRVQQDDGKNLKKLTNFFLSYDICACQTPSDDTFHVLPWWFIQKVFSPIKSDKSKRKPKMNHLDKMCDSRGKSITPSPPTPT